MKSTIAITGAAGTVGQAFVALLKNAFTVFAIDSNEWALTVAEQNHPEANFVLDDFANWDLRTDYLIHCAAYKRADLGEAAIPAFIENNVTKTQRLFEKVAKRGTKILFISTDKAVEPVGTYGFTKALGEKLAIFYGGSVARMGNILSSTGSVIPAWEDQIQKKQPLTVTDERMTRYVLEVEDAVEDIWNGFLVGKQLIIPKMGDPIRLMDLLAEVLHRHGYKKTESYKPGVLVTGKRPGEKLTEKLVWDHEHL